ncbi:MAG TPA: GNAT family N-acetyltransferase [Candidatus Binatus sp.]|nr:GNAT family N-acetyltransferase [Candidatus Binatus sp.]
MLSVRAATRADEEPVLALLEELFDPPARRAPGYTRERGTVGFRHAVSSPDADVLLAVDGHVVGLASVYVALLSMRFGHRCWLEDLVVTSSRRSAGIGRLLLDAATSWARAHGCTHLELESAAARKDAHRFYVASGMTQTALSFARWIG